MSARPHPLKRKLQAGFSLMEAIVALVIASMVLATILPIASRSVSDNLRIGLKGLDAFALSIQEQSFRSLAAAAVPAPQQPMQPPSKTMLTGDAKGLQMTASSPTALLCASPGEPVAVHLDVLQDTAGGSLVCSAADGLKRELFEWKGAAGTLAYSVDGRTWSPVWPVTATAQQAARVVSEFGGMQIESVSAPYVRFSLAQGDKPQLTWIARFGQPRPVEYRVQDMLGGVSSGQGVPPPDFIP